ncbi:MAG: hypothetical protein M0Z63_10070 [Actinomycetota bacterium]|jgi:hypothetical protein|nr:hypothetical protein [Actinomycetota bacterium]
MAVRTTWDVEHGCGHVEAHDLSAKRPAQRAGYARWLASRHCTGCWQQTRDNQATEDRDSWLAERRSEEVAAADAWETRAAMPALDGSDKAVCWARRVRHQLLVAAYDTLGLTDGEFGAAVETPARQITSASWWIDQRDVDASDVAELVSDAAADATARTTENPW